MENKKIFLELEGNTNDLLHVNDNIAGFSMKSTRLINLVPTVTEINEEIVDICITSTKSKNGKHTLFDKILNKKIKIIVTFEDDYNTIDLGLPSGTKWCDRNIGASSPEEYGFYFAWGETDGYTKNDIKSGNCPKEFNWNNYKFGRYNELSKYNESDRKTTLDPENDATRTNMGGDWRMPTREQFKELLEYTTNEWVKDYNGTGVSGRLFTSKINGNSIFVPAAGYAVDGSVSYVGYGGDLWSSSLYEDYVNSAWNLGFYSDNAGVGNYGRYFGFPVRAVLAQ